MIYPEFNLMADIELGWCCGFIDGEGCIRIDKTRTQIYTYRPAIRVSNTNIDALKRIRNLFKRGIIYKGKREEKANHKIAYQWCVDTLNAIAIAKMIQPHLIIKRKQCDLLLEFYDKCMNHTKKKWGGSNKIPNDIQILREIMFDEMCKLNKRGI